MNYPSSYGDDDDKLKADFSKIYLEIAENFSHNLTANMLKTNFNLAKEDIGNKKFTWEELHKAMMDSMRTSDRFPTYSTFYKNIMDEKQENTQRGRASDVEEQWRAFKSYTWSSFVIRDDVMYTIGVKYGLHEELRRSDKYTINAVRKRFNDLLYQINSRKITPSQDPHHDLEHLFVEHSPFKYISTSSKDKVIYYEDKRIDDRIFSFDDPRWN